MEEKPNYTLVGLFVLILATGLLATILWLSTGFDKKNYQIYAVYIHEAVAGLSEDSQVKYNGVPVGNVYKIKLSHTDPQEVKILLNIVEGTPITTSTFATLITQGITGNTYIGLSAESAKLTPLRKLPHERYPIIPTKPSLLNQVDKLLKDVSTNIDNVSLRINEILDKKSIRDFKQTLTNVELFTSSLAKQHTQIAQSITHADNMLASLAKASQDFPRLTRELSQNFKHVTDDVSQASKSIKATMTSGEGTLNQLSQQAVPAAIRLLEHLNHIAVNFEKVSMDIRRNPAVILRGLKAPPNGPGE